MKKYYASFSWVKSNEDHGIGCRGIEVKKLNMESLIKASVELCKEGDFKSVIFTNMIKLED